jgi:hypothetical protein
VHTLLHNSKGPKVGSKMSKPLWGGGRNRNRDQPRGPSARFGNDRSTTARSHSHTNTKQSQISFAYSPKSTQMQTFERVEEDPWQTRTKNATSTTLDESDEVSKAQKDASRAIEDDHARSRRSPGGPSQSALRPPPGLAPLFDTARSSAMDMNDNKKTGMLPPIGHESTPIGGNALSGLRPDRTGLGIPPLQSDHTDGFLLRAQLLGTDLPRDRCLSGDDMSVFSVGTSSSVAIPHLSPLPQSTFGASGTISTGLTGMDDDDKIEADLQELGGQMVGSVLD